MAVSCNQYLPDESLSFINNVYQYNYNRKQYAFSDLSLVAGQQQNLSYKIAYEGVS